MFSNVFTSSTPETRPDWCDSVGTWRCAHVDAFTSALLSYGADSDVYVTGETNAANGARRMFVGYRDNRNSKKHSARLVVLANALRTSGLRVRISKHGDRVNGMKITDKG